MHTCTNGGGGQKPCTDPGVWATAAETVVTHLQVSDQNDILRFFSFTAVGGAAQEEYRTNNDSVGWTFL